MKNQKMGIQIKPCWAWAGWEPERHYRRIGRSGTAYFGRGAWLDDWRARADSPETLRVLADAGVTALVTWCYKGFGLEIESREWPRLRQFIESAHDLNLQVFGYVQAGSLYRETLLAEQPRAEQWFARRYNGERANWGGQYYRVFPCLGNDDYLAYMERVLVGALDLGLDGIHMDNSYHPHCWCARCQTDFRAWLEALPDLEERTGLPDARHVEAPPLPSEQDVFSDPLQQLRMEFGVQRRLAALQRFQHRIRQTRADALFLGNPAFPRRPGFKAQLAFDPAREGTTFDAIFAENGNLPGMDGEQYISQVAAYSYGVAGGYRVLSSAWQKGAHGHSPAADAAQIWTQLAEEFSYDAAWLGNNWALRAAGDGDRLLMDDNPQFETFVNALRFFRELEQTADLGRRAPGAEIAVLIAPDTLTFAAQTDAPALAALLQELLGWHLPFRFLFAGQPIPLEVRALLVWQQSCLSDENLAEIRQFADRPDGVVLIAGDSGWLNQSAIPRNASDWSRWLDHPQMHHQPLRLEDDALVTASKQHFGTDKIRSSASAHHALSALLAHWNPLWKIMAPPQVLAHAERSGQRLLFHLRDQAATGKALAGCCIELDASMRTNGELLMYYPDQKEATRLELKSAEKGRQTVKLPPFHYYALVEMPLL